ncbi:hypothetical protein PEC18_37860 [Paucibacter sp. O1-1]|nr:hypothetical protein [Paucibacter sp. O1-1]MDA3831394.1 hypothetical protein [Paucibacter sp. O1-1]
MSVVTVTRTPPPPYPVTRASGPVVAIRWRLSDDEKQAAREQVAAARAAAQGGATAAPVTAPEPAGNTAPSPAPGLPVQAGGPRPTGLLETAVRVAQPPAKVYAVVAGHPAARGGRGHPGADDVGARAPQAAHPDQGEVLLHQGRWRAALWPFASLVEAERAQAMLVGRGMRVEVIES